MSSKNEDIPMDESFEKYFGWNIKLLWYMGIVIDLNGKRKTSSILQKLPTLTTIFLGIADGIFQVLWIFDAWSYDKYLVTQISSNLLSNITAISKGFRMMLTVDNVQSVVSHMAFLWRKNRPDEEYRESILRGAQKSLFICNCYSALTLAFLTTWSILPFQKFFYQYHNREVTNHTYDFSQRIFMVRYPFEISTMTTYFSVLFEELWVLFGSALSWLSCDALFAQLLTQVCLQLKILQYDINKFVNCENDDIRLKEHLVICIKRHQDLLRICDLIENIFSPIIFTTMMVSSLNMCVNVFELKEMLTRARYVDASIHVFLFTGTFLQIFVYCTFAETLTGQTYSLAETIYNSKWTERNSKFRIYLQMLMLKSQQAFYCTAYGFFPIGHVQLTKIMKGSMSYFMYLETMN